MGLIQSSLNFANQHSNARGHYSKLSASDILHFRDQWIVDGGATSHFTGHRTDFITMQDIPTKLVKGMNLNAVGIGQVKISVKAILKSDSAVHSCNITLHNVLYFQAC